jgi:hypothetical protein
VSRVRVVIRKVAVDFREQFDQFASTRASPTGPERSSGRSSDAGAVTVSQRLTSILSTKRAHARLTTGLNEVTIACWCSSRRRGAA